MSTATILITGLRLPYHVVDYAINWAKDNEGSLRVIFLVPGKMPEEGYPFPNDLDEAEQQTTRAEVEKGLSGIVLDEIRYIEKRCNGSHIPVKAELMFSPPLKKLVSKINETEVLFIDKNIDEDTDDMSSMPFTIEDVTEQIKSTIAVGEMDRYSDVVF